AGQKHHKAYKNIDEIKSIFTYDPYNTGAKFQHDYQLKQHELDVVSICTPSHLRETPIDIIIDKGSSILVEKPLALTLESAQYIIDLCRERPIILAVVMQKRFNPDIQKLCGEVRAETLGKPLIASMQVRWYRPASYYEGWKEETYQGGSILINQALHHIDILQWIMGPVRSVYGHVKTLGHKINTSDSVVATFEFQNEAIATLEASTIAYPQNIGESLTILSEWGQRTIDTAWPHHEPVIRNFVECVRERKEPMVTGEESLKSLKIALAIQESSDTGMKVYFE
ncbi:hypothetical protein LCGC14_2949430, partial [marine sediment metagenome]